MQFCNGTTWMSMAGGGPGSGPMSLISTQTASASASLQFSNLPTSYNTLFLNCAGLTASSITSVLYSVHVGEGAGPTWEVGANYTLVRWTEHTIDSAITTLQTTTASDMIGNLSGLNVDSISLQLYIDKVGSSSIHKYSHGSYAHWSGVSSSFEGGVLWGYWNNDTNPITGLEVNISAGNIASGTCSLYGMN